MILRVIDNYRLGRYINRQIQTVPFVTVKRVHNG